MIISDHSDLSLARDAFMFFRQSLPECESRDRCKKWLEAIDLEIKVTSLIRASGEKEYVPAA